MENSFRNFIIFTQRETLRPRRQMLYWAEENKCNRSGFLLIHISVELEKGRK